MPWATGSTCWTCNSASRRPSVRWNSSAIGSITPGPSCGWRRPSASTKAGASRVRPAGIDQKGTNGKRADWVDYSNRVEGEAAGLALFSHPANPRPHRWLTRDYGCFGPRRVDARSGRPFTLARGESIGTRVGLLVHRGDVKKGRVQEIYQEWCRGRWR